MEVWDKLDIELTKEVWYPGETVQGHAVVKNSENVKVRSISIMLRGEGHTEWKILRGGDWRTVKDSQIYFTGQSVLWGHNLKHPSALGDGHIINWDEDVNQRHTNTVLPHGQHRWKFQFPLPESCLPCSFESKSGHIRYYLLMTVDLPIASSQHFVHHITLIAPHVDCMETRYLIPHYFKAKSKPCCWMCVACSRPLSVIANLDRSAYCCGEHIKLRCHVYNGENRCHRLRVRLVQRTLFHVTGTVMGISRQLQSVPIEFFGEMIRPRSELDVDLSQYLYIPPMPPTLSCDYCKLIQITYFLQIGLVECGSLKQSLTQRIPTNGRQELLDKPTSSSGRQTVSLEIPITIGTLPFRIPNDPPLVLDYRRAVDLVEGGKYVSPEFCQGQVYDGTAGMEKEEMVVFQPVYVTAKVKSSVMKYIHGNFYEDESCMEKISTV